MAVDPSVLDDSTAVNGDGDRAAETKEGQSGEVELVANEEGKSKKRKRSKADQNPVPADDGTAGDPEKKGKAKDTSLVNTQAEGEKAEKKSKKGKAVAEVPSEAVQANVAALDPETHEAKASIDSKKKRKRSHVDEVDAPHTEPSPKEKKSKKSKKTSKRSDDPQSEAAILGDSNAIPDSKSVSGGDMKVKKDKKSKKDKKAETAASAA
ncbi:hypothetical protein BDN71DRAFT_1452220 [Pleurotus eryngii]|uniref:Uncharacterized protein n=1 Tax=Pleurotus eryngii TaxID=5323 RepID=A0A9P5ZUB4_PLEER|nr:hypothetical protein BDN71DRAFT_1452220 [Pleurotus eryngii]